jgi:ParB-like chromosome segregation protein Spo0J
LKVDPEFHALIPPLSAEERRQLEANLQADGCRDPLVVWNAIILDGHNRYDVCRKWGITFQTVEHPCQDRNGAMLWIIRNQFGRRNLQPYQRAELALKLEPLIATRAKAQQRQHGGTAPGRPNTSVNVDGSVDTRAELARASGLSGGTIHKARAIAEKAPESVKEQLRRGETSIDGAYQKLRGQTQPKKPSGPRAAKKPGSTHFDQALHEAREWMKRWAHLSVLAPVFDAITMVIERQQGSESWKSDE